MPTLARTCSRIPSSSNGASSAATIRSATCRPVGAVARADEQHGELVAAQAGERVARFHGVAQAAGDVLQQPVAVGVAERVVDGLEIVEVDDHERERGARATQLALEPLAQQHAVGQGS